MQHSAQLARQRNVRVRVHPGWVASAVALASLFLFLVARLDVALGLRRGSVTGWVREEGWSAVAPNNGYAPEPVTVTVHGRALPSYTVRILSVTAANGRSRRTFSQFEDETMRQIERVAGTAGTGGLASSTSPVWGRLEYAGLGRNIVTRFIPEPAP